MCNLCTTQGMIRIALTPAPHRDIMLIVVLGSCILKCLNIHSEVDLNKDNYLYARI